MRRLIYASHWAEGVREEAHHVLQAIVSRAIANNRQVDVTGFLISHNGVFLQVLEGPERAVAELFARVAGDKRHTGLKVLSDEDGVDRAFRCGPMAGAACWQPDIAETFDAAAANEFDGVSTSELISLLQAVAHTDLGRVPCTVAA